MRSRLSVNCYSKLLAFAGIALCCATCLGCSAAKEDLPCLQCPSLEKRLDPALQCGLEQVTRQLGLEEAAQAGNFGLAIADITVIDRPRYAGINAGRMMYAASLPKIAILFAVLKQAEEGKLKWTPELEQLAEKMIRRSCNSSATKLYNIVGPGYLNSLLLSQRYGLYGLTDGGGLWVGKEYGKGEAWFREPLNGISHAASPKKVVHFYYLLESGRLLSPPYKRKMKEILALSELKHKFIKGLASCCPKAVVYRKGGSWMEYHSDSALIYHNGKCYIVAALIRHSNGMAILEKLIAAIDKLVAAENPCR